MTRLLIKKQWQETENEKQIGEKADQEIKQLNGRLSEFLARRGLVGELSHMDEREQVEPWLLFFRKKK